jgi:hypothetical protein
MRADRPTGTVARAALSLAASVALLGAGVASAQPTTAHEHPASLPPIHPDESVEVTLHQRLSLDQALAAAVAVRGALASFEQLTYEVRGKVPKQRLTEIGNTDPEMQTIGFHNLPGTIEGTLRLQDWNIKRLRWELAAERLKDGRASEAEVRELKAAFDAADEAFRSFWSGFGIGD